MNQDQLACAWFVVIAVPLGAALVLAGRWLNRGHASLVKALGIVARVFGWFLIGWALLGGSCFFLHGIPLVLVIVFVIVMAIAAWRGTVSQQYALLGLMTVAAERGMPLAPVIEAFGRERGGRVGRRAERLAGTLLAGESLPNALRACRRVLPRRAIPMVNIGCAIDALAPALCQAATARRLMVPFWETLSAKLGYILFLPAYGFVIVTFIMLKIVPMYEKIFRDFGRRMPAMSEWLIQAGRWWDDVGMLSCCSRC